MSAKNCPRAANRKLIFAVFAIGFLCCGMVFPCDVETAVETVGPRVVSGAYSEGHLWASTDFEVILGAISDSGGIIVEDSISLKASVIAALEGRVLLLSSDGFRLVRRSDSGGIEILDFLETAQLSSAAVIGTKVLAIGGVGYSFFEVRDDKVVGPIRVLPSEFQASRVISTDRSFVVLGSSFCGFECVIPSWLVPLSPDAESFPRSKVVEGPGGGSSLAAAAGKVFALSFDQVWEYDFRNSENLKEIHRLTLPFDAQTLVASRNLVFAGGAHALITISASRQRPSRVLTAGMPSTWVRPVLAVKDWLIASQRLFLATSVFDVTGCRQSLFHP